MKPIIRYEKDIDSMIEDANKYTYLIIYILSESIDDSSNTNNLTKTVSFTDYDIFKKALFSLTLNKGFLFKNESGINTKDNTLKYNLCADKIKDIIQIDNYSLKIDKLSYTFIVDNNNVNIGVEII